MDLASARTVLGVTAGDDWSTIRASYRERIRCSHPDIAGIEGTAASAELNLAYRALAIARREGRLHADIAGSSDVTTTRAPSPPTRPGAERRSSSAPRRTVRPHGAPDDVVIADGDTLVFKSTPGETFRRVAEATSLIGSISYIDRSAAILEAVLPLEDGSHASFVVSLQWRAHNAACEAFCTLEALERSEHLDVSGVLEQLIELIPPDGEFGDD